MSHLAKWSRRWIAVGLVSAMVVTCAAGCKSGLHGTVYISSDPDVPELDDPFGPPPPPRE